MLIREMNERATAYLKHGLNIEDAIKQTVTDFLPQLRGVGYKILSLEEIERHHQQKFFEELRMRAD